MPRPALRATVASLALAAVCAAHADVLPGQGTWASVLQPRDLDSDGTVDAYFDTSRQLTWLADADPIGPVDWNTANAWATGLTLHGSTGWRLPTLTAVGGGVPTCAGGYTYDGSGDCGYNVSPAGSELAHMNQVLLGNKPYWDSTSNGGNSPPQPGWGLSNTGPFGNLRVGDYATGVTDQYQGETYAWLYQTGLGYQDQGEATVASFHAWAVHEGDVAAAVPEPGTWVLMLAGLGGVAALSRRHQR